MNVFIIGIGLIGGSYARDIRQIRPGCRIFGIDADPEHLQQALSMDLIDEAATYRDLEKADLVLVSIPVDALVRELPVILDCIGEQTLVLDAGSTKNLVCKAVEDHDNRRNFLACHPIAGTEFSGPSAAISGLYQGKTNIICEVEKTAFKLQERALDLFRDLGMRIRYMNPDAHDKHIAYVSHLSHISSFMLGKTVIEKEKNERDIFDMAGSGFESTVRLAKSSPAMWTPIFRQNKDYILEILNEYIANLEGFKAQMLADDFDGIYREMDNTNKIREILDGIPLNKVK
ncbi:prephenate dehydrogenase [Zeaxanthinibacter enoshimensis]|uniref:prephenate dehydrogenase n=1 Tax=Zeaxanthinibacter enoshimensis TaxID=392009 RepID=UPI003562F8FF